MPNSNSTSRRNSTPHVWVGCKLPHGIVLELFRENPAARDTSQAALNIRAFMPPSMQARVTLKGASSVRNDFTLRGLAQPIYPFGVTAVPEDFWDEWFELHKDMDAIRNGFIFVVRREKDAASAAREREPERTGIEPLRPDCENDPRLNQRSAAPEQRVTADKERLASLNRANSR